MVKTAVHKLAAMAAVGRRAEREHFSRRCVGCDVKGGMVNLERKKQRTTNMHTSAPEHGDHDGTLTIDQACTIPELRT